ncbi:MAG: NUDIX domain-containing protein [Flavobacteriaceae bacterium]
MQFHSFLEFVPKIQELPLPGLSEQLTMAPAMRKQLLEKSIINPKNAAVICLFYKGIQGETSFYLIRRSSYPGVHSNQVGFPGGQIDPSDQTPWDAAKRELWEELGIVKSPLCTSLQAIFGSIVFWRIQRVKSN